MKALRILSVLCTASAAVLCFVIAGLLLAGDGLSLRAQALMAATLGVLLAFDAVDAERKIRGGTR